MERKLAMCIAPISQLNIKLYADLILNLNLISNFSGVCCGIFLCSFTVWLTYVDRPIRLYYLGA